MANSKPKYQLRPYKQLDTRAMREMHEDRLRNEKEEMKKQHQDILEKFQTMKAQYDELVKNYNYLCSNNEILKNENLIVPELKEELQKYKSESRLKIDSLNSTLLDTKRQLQEKTQLLQNLESYFKDVLIKVLNLNEDEQEKSLEEMKQIFDYIESHKIKTKKKEDEKEPEILDVETYLNSRLCLCGNEKRLGAKGCEDCRKLADSTRNRKNIGMAEGWIEVWKSFGKIIDKPVDLSIESNMEDISNYN